jgi:hypothetical protein
MLYGAELAWGESLLQLERFSLDASLPVDRYTEVFPEYVKVSMRSGTGTIELGAAPWRRLRSRFLRWLQGERVEAVIGSSQAWTGLVHFEPLQYSLCGSVQRPPWTVLLQDARSSPVIAA